MIPVDKVKRIRGALGLAMSAGAVSVGVGLVIDAVRRAGKSDRRKKGSASRHVYVFCASDASEATKKRVFDKCAYYEIPVYELPITREELAHDIGKTGAVAAVAISNEGLAHKIIENLSYGDRNTAKQTHSKI
ncbi:MAG: ribosomal L7Ae/L30e/S12e/Gadd45 family protein [Eubacteriales bacterium]